MKSLVVPVNFTNNAANAARYAADMALVIDADIHLLHVMDASYAPEERQEKGRLLVWKLQKEVADRTHGKVNCSFSLQFGGVEARIEECCDRIRPFAVVMGAEDEKFHGGFSYDYVANALSRLHYPLLVIPAGAVFHVVRRVVLACETQDILTGIPVPLAFLKELKQYFGCTFDVVNVKDKNEPKSEASIFELYRSKESLQDLFTELHFVESKQVAEGMQEYLQSHGVDWLMVFPKKHGLLEFHRSKSKRVVAESQVPVLSVRA